MLYKVQIPLRFQEGAVAKAQSFSRRTLRKASAEDHFKSFSRA